MTANLNTVSDDMIKEEYVRRFTIQAGDVPITSASVVADHFRGFFADAQKKEQFTVLFLNGQNQVLSTETLFEGSLTSSAVYPREVITRVIELGAAAVVLAHNHPSGSTQVSSSDRQVTKKLQTALDSIDVKLLDHLILGGSEYFSFADAGLI